MKSSRKLHPYLPLPLDRLWRRIHYLVRRRNYLLVRYAALALMIIVPTLLFPSTEFTYYAEFKVGTISPSEVRAPLTFPVYKSLDQLARERNDAQALIAPVFERSESITKAQLANLDELISLFYMLRKSPKPFVYTDNDGKTQTYIPQSFDSLRNSINKKYGLNVLEDRWHILIGKEQITDPVSPARMDTMRQLQSQTVTRSLTYLQFEEFARGLSRFLSDQFAVGIVNVDKNSFKSPISPIGIRDGQKESTEFVKSVNDLDEARYRVQDILRNGYRDPKLINLSYEILTLFLTPNLIYKEDETNRRRADAVTGVPQTYGFVLAGDVIVGKNESITPTIHQQLISLETALAEKRELEGGINWFLPYLGRGLLVFTLMFFLMAYVFFYREDIFYDVQKFTLLVSLVLLEIFFYYVVIHIYAFPIFVIPIVFSSVLVTVLFDVRLGLIATASLSFLIGAMQGNEYTTTIVLAFVGAISCVAVFRISRRSHVFTSILWVSLAYVFIIITMSFVKYTDLTEAILTQLPYALISGILSMLLAFGCLVLFESIFDVCTTFTLMELADSNHPLQQQLALNAPGTYHHSVIVGNLAAAAAEAVGANPLLARVGGLYHDIGKCEMAEYFVENQFGADNKHEQLTPRMSAMILQRHITKGLEMAQTHRIPRIIQHFIPEHHGHQLMTYFYHKALEKKQPLETLLDTDFRYQGPRPQTKESGILMLADGVEAATHSIKEPTADKVRSMVSTIVQLRLQDGELDECDLTIGDLKKIESAFIPLLQSIHHVRPEYPTPVVESVTKPLEVAR